MQYNKKKLSERTNHMKFKATATIMPNKKKLEATRKAKQLIYQAMQLLSDELSDDEKREMNNLAHDPALTEGK